MNKVAVNNIVMNYHSIDNLTTAIENITFNVEDGEFLSIVGPSGCGKSTLLNIIAGLLKPSHGEVYIDQELSTSFSPKIGYMFQKDQLFDWLSVLDNVLLGLKIQHKISHYPNELSGGMRQKVALIRTLALNPEVLLLDEPFSALDYQTRLNISDEIFNIIKKEKKTVIMVTHDISEAISMSNRVIVLTRRPSHISKIFDITFSEQYNSPLKSRKAKEFKDYFNDIWKELNN